MCVCVFVCTYVSVCIWTSVCFCVSVMSWCCSILERYVITRLHAHLTTSQKPLTRDKEGELLYFGDVCAGPGGFSEYVLWRRKWHAKGFGMTIRGPNDFKLEDFYAAPSELFEPYYGTTGAESVEACVCVCV